MMNAPLEVSTSQMSHNEMISDLSEPSSPESVMYDTAELLGTAVHDEVTNQLAAAGPIGVAAAAAVLSSRKRKHPHHFETNPSRRKRQQTRLLRKLRHTIEEYTARVGQQAVVLCCTPNVSQTMQMYKVFGSQPLENVIRNNKQHILAELEQALTEQTPTSQQENSHLHELPPLVIDGIPTQVDKMTQAQLRNFIPEMLKYSTGRSKPGWGRPECRPVWWPSDLPWANVRSDVRAEDDKKKVPWTDALRQIVKNCYMHHGRQDLLQVFKECVPHLNVQVQQAQQAPYPGTMMQTINNPDGTLSIIQIDPGPNNVVTLADGTQATVVHAVQDGQLQQQTAAGTQQFTEIVAAQDAVTTQTVATAPDVGMVTGGGGGAQQQVALNAALQASINSGGHIILAGADAAQLGSIMTVLPVSMYQPVQTLQSVQGLQGVQAVQGLPSMSSLPPNLNFQLQQPGGQPLQIAMTPGPVVTNSTEVATTAAVQVTNGEVVDIAAQVQHQQQQQQQQLQQQQQQQQLQQQVQEQVQQQVQVIKQEVVNGQKVSDADIHSQVSSMIETIVTNTEISELT